MLTVFIVASIATAWVVFYQLNIFFFSSLELNPFASWIFLPAGIKLLSILLFDYIAIAGLFIGAMITSDILLYPISHLVFVSAISAINPYFAVKFSKYCLKLDNLFYNLQGSQLLIICFVAAVFNSVTQMIYLKSIKIVDTPLQGAISMMIGDFLGCVLVLLLFVLAIKLFRKYLSADN